MAAIILQSLSLRGLPFCDDDETRVHLAAWGRVLADVPTDQLDESFALAVGKLDEAHSFTPTHILKAYEALKRERFYEARAQTSHDPQPRPSGIRPGYVAGPVDDYSEMNRPLSIEENAQEFAYWSRWLDAQKAAKAEQSRSGMAAADFRGVFDALGEKGGDDAS